MDLSVIIPCHNEGLLLKESVNSVMRQKWLPDQFEVLVIADNINKETSLAIDDLQALYQVRVLQNQGEPGPAGSRNAGLKNANGRWVAFLDADDFWLEDAVLNRWQAILKYPDAQWVTGDFACTDEVPEDPLISWYSTRPPTHRPYQQSFEDGSPLIIHSPMKAVLFGGMPHTNCVMVRREVALELGGFDTRLKQYQDVHLWIRLARIYPLVFVPELIAVHRNRSCSVTKHKKTPEAWGRKMFSMLIADEAFARHKSDLQLRLQQAITEDMWYCRHQMRWREAIGLNLEALKNSPGNTMLWRSLLGAVLRRP